MPDDRTRLSFSLERSRQRYRNDYGIPAIGDRPADIDRDHQFNEGGPLSRQDNTVARIDLAQTLSERWTLNVHALALDQDGAQYDLIPSTSSPERRLIAPAASTSYNYEPHASAAVKLTPPSSASYRRNWNNPADRPSLSRKLRQRDTASVGAHRSISAIRLRPGDTAR